MKKIHPISKALLLPAIMLAFGQIHSSAQTILGSGNVVTANGAVAPGDGLDYYFFATGGGPNPTAPETDTVLSTNFAVTLTGRVDQNRQETEDGLDPAIPVGLPGTSPVIQVSPGHTSGSGGGAPFDLLTFQLDTPGITSFAFYVLNDNTAFGGTSYPGTTFFLTTSTNTSPSIVVSDFVVTPAAGTPELDYAKFVVTGAYVGETFSLTGGGDDGSPPTLGGITFDTSTPPSATPEPSTYALLFGALTVLMYMRRRTA